MYTPKHFVNENTTELIEFMRQNPFAMLITQHEGRPFATQLPFELTEKPNSNDQIFLLAHLAKANPQWQSFSENGEVLVVFTGPHSYVSSSWYEKPDVSTWNYMAVHAYGKIRILEALELRELLAQLTRRYESDMEKPLFLEDMSSDYIDRQLRAIVGFEVEVTGLEGKWKLSQNRKTTEQQRVILELGQSEFPESRAVASAMQNLKNKGE